MRRDTTNHEEIKFCDLVDYRNRTEMIKTATALI
jgi:hypothetical protein